MTYQEIIQSPGKSIDKNVYYYDENNNRVDVNIENIEQAKITSNCDIIGTLMKGLELILKEKIDTPNEIYLEVVASYGDEEATQTYGPYYIYDTKYNADEKTYTHSCYDYILKTMVDYEPINITYPTTIQNYFNKLVETLGMTSSVSLINGANVLSSDVFDGMEYTYRSVLQDIAQANGVLLYVDSKQIKEASFGSVDNQAIVNDDILKNTNIDFGEHFGPINVIVLSRSGGSDNIYYPRAMPSNPHEFKISDNQLLNDNNRDNYIRGIYDKLNGIEYDIFDTELVGYGGFEPLQRILFQTGGNQYVSYCFNNEITITAGYNEAIYTDLPSESETDYNAADTTDKRINQTYLIVDKQNQKIESVVSDVSEQDEKISQISQEVGELKAQISDISDLTTSGESSYASVELQDINESNPIYFKIRPINNDIAYLYPNNGLFPSDELYCKTRILRFKNTETNEEFDYELPGDLLYLNENVYDELIYNYEETRTEAREEQQGTIKIIKRCDYDEDGNVYQLSGEQTTYYDFPDIQLTSGDYVVSLLGYSNGYIQVRLMCTNIYTTQFYTKAQTESLIDQTSSSIQLSVNQQLQRIDGEIDDVEAQLSLKVGVNDNNKIVSMLNAAADEITLSGGSKLHLTSAGKLTISAGNFKLDENGSMTATNATFNGNITGGTINIGDNFSVDTSGTMRATNGVFYTTGTTGGAQLSNGALLCRNDSDYSNYDTTGIDIFGSRYRSSYKQDGISIWNRNQAIRYAEYSRDGAFITTDGTTGWALTPDRGLYQTSDRRAKKDIIEIDEEKSKNIIKELKPVEYTYLNSDIVHRGLIAQDVEEILNKNGINDQVYVKDENGRYSLVYEEFIADLINCNKYLINKIEELETRIGEIENGK